LPPLPWKKIAKREPADGDALELMHLVTELGKHAADLAILAFVENHLEDGALLVLAAEIHPLGVHFSFGQANALAEPVEQFGARDTGDLHEVFLLDAVAWMGQKVGQVTVVREKDESFTRPIEPSHGEETTIPRNEVDDPGASCRVVIRCDHTNRLVEHVDDAPRIRELLAVDSDFLGARIDLRAERGDDLAVDFDAT
jgi:hypothetical protein